MARATDGTVRVLSHGDTPALRRLLAADPVANVTVSSAVGHRGTAAPGKGRGGALLFGIDADHRDGNGHSGLASACWVGSNIIPVAATDDDAALFGQAAAALRRRFSSVYGRADPVLALHRAAQWSNYREVRPHQPLMSISEPSPLEPLEGVRPSRLEEFDAVETACAAMFTEELGFSPYLQGAAQYRDRIRALIRAGHSLISVDPETLRIVFKAEFGAVSEEVAQVQGVWVDPEWRGRGLAAPGMAAVVNYGLQLAPTVSLYVNSWNAPAVRAYERAGFTHDGAYATVLF